MSWCVPSSLIIQIQPQMYKNTQQTLPCHNLLKKNKTIKAVSENCVQYFFFTVWYKAGDADYMY